MSRLDRVQKITIRPWPKMIFSWPTALFSAVAGGISLFFPDYSNFVGIGFILVLGLNTMVLTFEFGRNTALSFGFCVFALIASVILLNQYSAFLSPTIKWILGRNLSASADFYFSYFGVHSLMIFGMVISTRFNYWQLTPNELIHKRGIFGDTERFSTSGLRLSKEIHDIFEYIIGGAGRLIVNTPGNRQIELENVLGIKKIERAANHLLGSPVVRVHAPPTAPPSLEQQNMEAVEQSS